MKLKQMPSPSEFDLWRETLNCDDREQLDIFFDEVDAHVLMPVSEKKKIINDFENAFLFYSSSGLSFDVILKRLNPEKLGGFYARPPSVWYPLDDAAKIYPLSMKHWRMAMFRLSVYMKRDVIPTILQMALNFTIGRFPCFATTVKSGLFWHYLDASKRRYTVEAESGIPCRPLVVSASGSQSFRIVYFQNRISVEYFHILTDGTGGLIFLKTLVAEYLRLLGVEHVDGEGVLNISDFPQSEETENAFLRTEKAKKVSGFSDKPAVQLGGALAHPQPCRIIHFKLYTDRLCKVAQQHNVSVTAYILKQIFLAGRKATDWQSGEMSIQVPVNMRKFYPSRTLRNFSMYCGIRIPMDKISDCDELTNEISRQLREKASRDSMSSMMASTESLVRLLRYIPLIIKAPIARHVYSYLGESIFSNTLSNLGVVKLPEGMAENIEYMDFVLGSASVNRASCALITCGNTSMLSVTKMTADPSFEEALRTFLEKDNLIIDIEGSERYDS